MNPLVMAASTAITLALVFYTIGIFGEARAGSLQKKHLILFWIGLSRLPEGADGLPRLKAWTNGLARFDKLEMEIPSTAADIHDAFILLNSAACYVLDHDAQMQPGEALEWKDGEVPLSLGKSSAIDEDQDVLIVDLDGLRPRGDGVLENKDEGEA